MSKQIGINKQSENIETPKRKKKINNDECLFAKLDDESCIDLNTEFTWKAKKLKDNQKLFIFYYVYPFSNKAKGKGAESARKAGYSEKSAREIGCRLLQNLEIYEEIKNIQEQISKKSTKVNILNEINTIIEQKLKRTQINATEYYNIETAVSDEGYEYTKAQIKTPDELTDEQKAMIEDVEFVGQRGIVHYKLPSKREAENELIKIYKELYNKDEEKKDDYDIETTVDVIKDSLSVKTKVIKKNSEITDLSDLKNNAENNRAEED